MKRFFQKYRKAFGAGIGTFLVGFPLVGVVDGSAVGDPLTLLKQAGAAAIVAGITAAFPANVTS